LRLQIRKRRVIISLSQDLIDLGQQPGAQGVTPPVSLVPGALHRSAEAGMEDRDVLRPRGRQVKVQWRLPGLPLRLDAQLGYAVIIRARLGGDQAPVDLHSLPGVRRCSAELLPVRDPFRCPNSRSYGSRSTCWPAAKPKRPAPGPHQVPGGSPASVAAR
jgi:hypothetical protein